MAPALGLARTAFEARLDVPTASPGPEDLAALPSPLAADGPLHGTRGKKARLQEAPPDVLSRLAALEAQVAQRAAKDAARDVEVAELRTVVAALRQRVAVLEQGAPRAAFAAAAAAQASAAAADAKAERAQAMAQRTDSHRQADHHTFSEATRRTFEGLERLAQQGLKANVIIQGLAEGAALAPVLGATVPVAVDRIGAPRDRGAPPRPVRVRFACVADKHRVLKERSKEMRALNITFRDDLTPLQRAAKRQLAPYHPALKDKGLTPYWRGARLLYYGAGGVVLEYQPGMPDDPLLPACGVAGGRGGPGGRGRAGGRGVPRARGGVVDV